jgi:hypothetical protein
MPRKCGYLYLEINVNREEGLGRLIWSEREVIGRWRKKYNEKFQYLISSPNIIKVIKSRKMGLAGPVTSMEKKRAVLWDITPCTPLKVNRRFGGTYCLHLQGRRISRARNQCKSRWKARWRWHVPPKRRLTFNGLHSYIPEDSTLHNHRYENLISHLFLFPTVHQTGNTQGY